MDMLYRGQAGHLGSSMSTVEILTAMYASVDVGKIKRGDPDRARVIISKGHCAAATYSAMYHYGLIDEATLSTYYKEGSILTGLVNHNVAGVEHSTGSLGHGLSVAAGAAVALRNMKSDSPVLCLLGDGEVQEGSNWEAWLLIKHLNLTRCVTLIDDNGIGMIDHTKDVIDMKPMYARFNGLGFRTELVDGHDVGEIQVAIADAVYADYPTVIVCKTVKGKGVPFAEDVVLWHYRTLNADTYAQALEALQ